MPNIQISAEYNIEPLCLQKIAKYVAEFIGTAWLVLIIKLSVVHFPYPSISIGAGLTAIIYTYGYVSKAHYNPSITLAFTIRNIEEWPRSDVCQIVMYYVVRSIDWLRISMSISFSE